MLKPTVMDRDGRLRMTVAFTPEVKQTLRDLARRDGRSLNSELSYLVMERARTVGLYSAGHILEKVRH